MWSICHGDAEGRELVRRGNAGANFIMNLADSATSPFQLPETGSNSASESKRKLKSQARAFLEAMAADSVAGKWIPDVMMLAQIELKLTQMAFILTLTRS